MFTNYYYEEYVVIISFYCLFNFLIKQMPIDILCRVLLKCMLDAFRVVPRKLVCVRNEMRFANEFVSKRL